MPPRILHILQQTSTWSTCRIQLLLNDR